MDKALFLEYIEETAGIEYVQDTVESLKFDEENPLYVFHCKLQLKTREVDVFLIIPKRFPEGLPKIFIGKFDKLGFLPHIEPNGTICFLEKESIYVNRDEPKAVFQASIELAIETLENGLSGKNRDDFREEFHVFWERNLFCRPLHVASYIVVDSEPKKVKILKNDKVAVFADVNDDEQRHQRLFKKALMKKSGIYLMLSEDSDLVPPKYDEQWSIETFVNWVKTNTSSQSWQKVERILAKNSRKYEYIIVGVPRNSGDTILVGVHMKPKKSKSHPFRSENSDWGLDYLKVNRYDTPAILPRSGANYNLQNKSVMIVGCGSVGSHVALGLTKMGIGKLSLVDHDLLEFGNLQRFAVGFEYVNQYKVKALQAFLGKNFLYTKVESCNRKIESALEENLIQIDAFDLIISATGDPTINMFLNEKLQIIKVPLIVAWNEPHGIGGHAQLSIPPKKGCYKCLYKNQYNLASFAAEEQPKPFHKKHLGCGEVFTPFSALDSSHTAETTCRLATSYLLGTSQSPQVISWKGESKEFTENEFQLSNRYINQTMEEMNSLKHEFINSDCNHCN